MAYIKYKEITKYFNFSKIVDISTLPKYTTDYVFEDERILAAYKTHRDYGVFTDKKIILFDNTSLTIDRKQVYIIPYEAISSSSVIFKLSSGEVSLFMDSGYPVRLKFINMNAEAKMRLRVLFSLINRYILKQPENKDDIKRLIENDFVIKK